MENFLWGLLGTYIAAVVSAAYRKPDFYLSKLDSWVMLLPIGCFFLAGVWSIATGVGYRSVRGFIPAESFKNASEQFEKTQLPTEAFFIIGGVYILAWVANFLANGMRNHPRS